MLFNNIASFLPNFKYQSTTIRQFCQFNDKPFFAMVIILHCKHKTVMQKLIIPFLFIISFGGNSQNFGKNALLKNGIALSGYDAISYFKGEPLKGKMSFKNNYEGAIFLFTNQTNLDAFKADPPKYLPQYGGWCAYAMGNEGEKVEVNPETFKIIGGKLFLFYNKFFNNTLTDWNKNEAKLKKAADLNWQKINK